MKPSVRQVEVWIIIAAQIIALALVMLVVFTVGSAAGACLQRWGGPHRG